MRRAVAITKRRSYKGDLSPYSSETFRDDLVFPGGDKEFPYPWRAKQRGVYIETYRWDCIIRMETMV